MKLNDYAYKNQQMHQSFYPQIDDRRFRKYKVSPIQKNESRDQCTSIISDILNQTPAKNLEKAKAKKQNLDLNVTLEVDYILKKISNTPIHSNTEGLKKFRRPSVPNVPKRSPRLLIPTIKKLNPRMARFVKIKPSMI